MGALTNVWEELPHELEAIKWYEINSLYKGSNCVNQLFCQRYSYFRSRTVANVCVFWAIATWGAYSINVLRIAAIC